MEQWWWPSNCGVGSGDPSSLTTTVQSPIYINTVSCTQPLLLLLSVCNTNYQNVTDHLMSCIIKASSGSAAYNIGLWPWSWTRDYYYVCTGRNAQTWFGGSPSQVTGSIINFTKREKVVVDQLLILNVRMVQEEVSLSFWTSNFSGHVLQSDRFVVTVVISQSTVVEWTEEGSRKTSGVIYGSIF